VLKRWLAPLSLALLLAACTTGALPLTLTDLNPEDGATEVAVDVLLTATFDRAIDAATLDGAFTLTAEGGAVATGTATLSGDGRTATFNPDANLAYSTMYTAAIAGTVATTSGVQLGGAASWSFTTEDEPDTLLVESTNPADDATDVSVDAVVTATFNTPIDGDTLDGAFALVVDGGAAVTGTVALDGTGLIASFTPDADLDFDTTYTATLAATVSTVSGLELGAASSWSFTTASEPLPEALVGGPYADTVVAENTAIDLAADVTGGEGAYAFALAVGDALPTGVSLDADTGAIAGTPTETGLFEGTVVVTDGAAQTVDLTYSIEVAAELVGGAYAGYDAASNVGTEIALLEPFTGGYGTITYAVTAGALPAAFTTLDLDPLVAGDYPDYLGGDTYEVVLDATTGTIGGFTGAVGTFTGTVTATDELGQTADATFELVLGFDLAYVDGTDYIVGAAGNVIVVNGDKVRVSGVPTDALPASFPVLLFELTYDGGASSGDVGASDFTINEGEGAITKVYENGGSSFWVYDVTVQAGIVVNEGTIDEGIEPDPDSTVAPSAPVTFTFEYVAPVI